MKRFDATRGGILFLVFATGFTGLVYEVVWQRYLGNLLGSEAKATSFILATFLGGLSLGYHLFGKTSGRLGRRSLIKLTGWLEVGIGLWAFFFPKLFQIIFTRLGVVPPEHPLSALWEFSVAAMLIGVPTVLMGGTLPLLTQALSVDLDDSSPLHASIYASNTGGAFFGCLAAGFVLLPRLGLPLTLMSTAPLNLLAGFSLILIGARGTLLGGDGDGGAQSFGPHGVAASSPGLLFVAAAFLAGFVSLTLQVLAIRLVGISAGSSEYAFSMVVSVFILMLALGARKLATRTVITAHLWANQLAAAAGLLLILATAPNWPYVSHVVRTLFSFQGPAFYLYHLALLLLCGAVLALAVAAMGRTMPLLFHTCRTRLDDLGQDVGTLYTWNTLGCLAGALIGGYASLYVLNLEGVLRICAVLLLATVPMACVMERRTFGSAKVLGSVSAALVLVWALPAWPDEKLAVGTFRLRDGTAHSYMGPREFYRQEFRPGRRILMRVDDPNTSVAVVQYPGGDKPERGSEFSRSLYVNGKSDGSTEGPDSATMKLLGHLPMLSQGEEAQRVAVIGYGLGLTVGSVLLHPSVRSVHVFEISPGVREAAKYFDFATGNASRNGKVVWKMGDAYRYLVSNTDRYSVIISEPSNPWVVGVERLYTEEFFRLSRSNLTANGVYAQWVQAYEMKPETIGMVVKTFSRVFRHVKLFSVSGADLIMLGSTVPFDERHVERMRSGLAVKAVTDDLALIGVSSMLDIFDAEVPMSPEAFDDLAVHTLENPKLSYQAGRDYFTAKHTPFREFLREPSRRVWTQWAERRSLAYGYLRALGSPTVDSLTDIGRTACRRPVVDLFPGWRESAYLCRQSLLGLALAGAIRAAATDDVRLVKVLQGLREGGRPPGDIGDARRAIVYFTDFDSPLLPLKLDALQQQAAPCLDGDSLGAIGCRALLVQAYCYLGLTKEAVDLFRGLANLPSEQLADSRKGELVELIKQSARAQEGVTGGPGGPRS